MDELELARHLAQQRADEARVVAREARAAGWYLQHPAVQVGRASCSACSAAGGAQLLRELRGDARQAKPPAQRQPYALEARYRGQLRRRVRATHRLLLQELRRALAPMREGINARARQRDRADSLRSLHPGLRRVDVLAELLLAAGSSHASDEALAAELLDLELDLQARRADSATSDARKLIRVVERVRRAVQAAPAQQALLLTLAEQVRSFTSRSVTQQLLTVAGLEVLPQLGQASALLGKWATDNVALISSLDTRYLDEVRDAVLATVGEGHSTASLSRAISERYGVARSRADLIATDQVGTLNAKITQERQQQLGVESYTWSSSGDSRVRPLHVQLDGTVRRWDDPHPTEGHPGLPIRCRCSAIPVI